jgi:hypothetical protein
MGEIQIANLHNRLVTAMLQQLCDLTTESLVLKEQTPQVTGLFVSNQQKTSIRRLVLDNNTIRRTPISPIGCLFSGPSIQVQAGGQL